MRPGRAPATLFLALPALAATGLLYIAHTVYGEFGNGFYSLDSMLCESLFAGPGPRGGRHPDRPARAGPGAGVGPGAARG